MKSTFPLLKRSSFWERLLPETKRWVGNIVANSGTISNNSIWIGDQFVKRSYINGYRSQIQVLYLRLGNNLNAALCPIIDDLSAGMATNVNFVEGDFTEIGGLGNLTNTNKYTNTNVSAASFGAANSYSMVTCLKEQTGTSSYVFIGAGVTTPSSSSYILTAAGTAGYMYSRLGGADPTNIAAKSDVAAKSIFIGSRTGTTTHYSYDDAAASANNSASLTDSPPALNIFTHARNLGGSPNSYSKYHHLIDGFGKGLDATQVTNLTTDLQWVNAQAGR